MKTIGVRDLRQNASDLLREVEAGEEITITVAGRPSARMIPATTRTWRRFDDLTALFAGTADPDWDTDRDAIDQQIRNPWDQT